MKKILVLNSGGFDSIVMLHDLARYQYPEAEIHSLHFTYGAHNDIQQAEAVKNACNELNCVDMRVTLPPFSWSKGDFFTPTDSTDMDANFYLEYRNLIFLAYASSYAESQGIKDIFFATIANAQYNDTKPEFVVAMNQVLSLSGIVIHTPYTNTYKEELISKALSMGLTPKDFFSCDYPLANGEPCGKCPKCDGVSDFDRVPTSPLLKILWELSYYLKNS